MAKQMCGENSQSYEEYVAQLQNEREAREAAERERISAEADAALAEAEAEFEAAIAALDEAVGATGPGFEPVEDEPERNDTPAKVARTHS